MQDINFKDWLLSEMPITNFNLIGKWKPEDRKYGYSDKDVGILTNQRAVDKIHRKWSNSKENFDLYFVKAPKAHTFTNVGMVDSEWVKKNLNLDIPANPDSITVIFTNNKGDEKVPMTAWTIAHRIGHVISKDKNFEYQMAKEITRDFDGLIKHYFPGMQLTPEKLARHIGTMKSARDNNLRNFFEFAFECVAQYLTAKKGIYFNPIENTKLKLPSEKAEDFNYELISLAEKYNQYLTDIFVGFFGEIFVM